MLNWLCNFFRKKSSAASAGANLAIDSSDVRYAAGDFGSREDIPFDSKWDDNQEWPTPDWESRRKMVLERDGFICQAIGCLRSGTNLHAHHKKLRWQGGNHKLDNLVALCPVHHAIVHLDTNKVEVNIPTCSVVSGYFYWRNDRKVEVPIHIRRHKLINVSELSEIRKQFGLKCQCGFEEWKGNFRLGFLERGLILIWCPNCNGQWEFEQGLFEETASQLAATFPPSRKVGKFSFNLNLIRGLKKPVWFEGCPNCLNEGRSGYLKEKRSVFGKFVGCSEWPSCDYKRRGEKQLVWAQN